MVAKLLKQALEGASEFPLEEQDRIVRFLPAESEADRQCTAPLSQPEPEDLLARLVDTATTLDRGDLLGHSRPCARGLAAHPWLTLPGHEERRQCRPHLLPYTQSSRASASAASCVPRRPRRVRR